MRTATHGAREGLRDRLYANTDTPAPRGEPNSSVGVDALTRLTHERLAAAGERAALPPDLAKIADVARTPPLAPGQARIDDASGVRNETSRFEPGKSTGKGNNTPER
ncbi:hypothetical protein [Kribbella speibonae]|uniref:Uncharacterized protein n=1 Tax=Kribbella speibonae TaxID=1572660 RepID=A0A4R0JC62_9ACTN|nr:hypothetical protein [Kribbella speibonae]TCC18003.1 hypothetical protein E0H58_34820 [Kribbella speibonae]TCC42018.1 hypothetical protein E0H92_10410 [Kribbella speibonae]